MAMGKPRRHAKQASMYSVASSGSPMRRPELFARPASRRERRSTAANLIVPAARAKWLSPRAARLRLGRSFPVEDQRDRRRLDHVSCGVEQEPLAVGRDDVLLPRQEAGVELCSNERHWGAENDLSVRAECHADRGQSLIGGNIEEFRPVFAQRTCWPPLDET